MASHVVIRLLDFNRVKLVLVAQLRRFFILVI